MTWIQGGPFLEISLLLKETKLEDIIYLVSSHDKVTIASEKIKEKINEFEQGYHFDEEDLYSPRIHSIKLNLLIDLFGERKSILFIERVADDTILMNYCFFGSEFDAPEWGQAGVKQTEYHFFIDFLEDILEYFNGVAGAISFENDILTLISDKHISPNNIFSFLKLNHIKLIERGKLKNFIAVGYREEENTIIRTFSGIS